MLSINKKNIQDRCLGDIKKELYSNLTNDIISVTHTQDIMTQAERQYYLSMNPYKITESNGVWMSYLPDEKSKYGRTKRTRKDLRQLENVIINYWKSKNSTTVGELILEWAEHKRLIGMKRNKFKKQTYDRYLTDFHRFFDGTEFVDMDLDGLLAVDVEDFIIERIDTLDLTAKTYSNMRTLLRGSLNYYVKRHPLSFDPESFFRSLDLRAYFADKEQKPQVFSDVEIHMIKKYIQEHEESVISYGILFVFYTGLRIGELSALKWEDVFDDYIYIHRTEERYKNEYGKYEFHIRDTPKTAAGQRRVFLTDEAQLIINRMRELNPNDEFVFMNKEGERIKGNIYTNKLKRICKSLGITPRSMHKARKTYASNLFRNQVDESIITDQMGHTDIKTTKEFYRFNVRNSNDIQDTIKKAINY